MGKTTLLHLLAGILSPTAGEVLVQDTNLAQLKGRALDRFRGQHIGLVFQQPHFVGALSVLENLVLAGWLPTGKKDPDRAQWLLQELHLTEQARKHPAQLSAGQQQRLSIARALMHRPSLLLADEPTASLDDTNCQQVAQLLQQQAQQVGAALVVVTHDQRLRAIYPNQINLH